MEGWISSEGSIPYQIHFHLENSYLEHFVQTEKFPALWLQRQPAKWEYKISTLVQ